MIRIAILLAVSFLEGGVLMAFEILSSKLYTPFLGSSIYVWTAILTVTLSGLALGYRLGGNLSLSNPRKHLLRVLLLAAGFIALTPFITGPILESLLEMDVKVASLLAGFLIIFIPITALGIVSPLIVGLLNKEGQKVPFASGLVYGIGTFGGILIMLLTTFLLIPSIGVNSSVFLLCILLVIAAGFVFTLKNTPHAQ